MAEITFMKTPAETRLGEHFQALDAALLSGRQSDVRGEAFARFAQAGLPHRRLEAWHYTDLRALLREALPPAPPEADAATVAKVRAWLDREAAAGLRLVLIDGTYRADLSRLEGEPGITIASVLDVLGRGPSPTAELLAAENLGTGESVLALNAAFMQGGVVLSVASASEPIEILCFVSGTRPCALATRSLVHLAAGASAVLIERHIGLGEAASQGNHALVFALGDGAELDHVAEIVDFPAAALHLGTCLARLDANARLHSFTLAATPGLTRRQAFVQFTGPHSTLSLRGVSLLSGCAHADTTLVVTHDAPHCESREYFKTILDGESIGIYQGKVVVSPGAQKTDGKMLSKAVFLADGASMYNKPELEIFADDVVCGHGATVGNLDEDQLFYLRARGIPEKDAQSLLLNAFAADTIEGVATETVRERLTGSVERWLLQRQS